MVGSEEPLKPAHSLPRYSEPTPETHRKVSREEEAELALKQTIYTPGTCWLLIALLLFTIALVPSLYLVIELHFRQSSGVASTLALSRAIALWESIRAVRRPADLWNLL